MQRAAKKQRKCQVCNLDHPTGLHGYIHKKKGGVLTNDTEGKQRGSNLKINFAGMNLKSASENITPNVISMCSVPVKASYAGSKKQISTYAVLDNCSQGCFVKDSIIKNLGADGRKTEITIKALNGEQKVKLAMMSGLKVRSDSEKDTKRWLDLPATYTKEELPVDVEEVATREKIEIWNHLKKVANKVPKVSDIEIGLLIGANFANALELQKVIPSKDGGPFAYKSPFDWCVVRPLVKDAKKGSISCNRIVVQDVTSGKMASHRFGITNEVKDVSAKQMLQRMYNQEFNESKLAFMEGIGKTDIEEISFEDREFLKMMNENSRKVGKHYELPLPLKNPAVTKIPNNSYLAETRLLSLKKRFFKDPDFFSDYKRFVEELIDKGYPSKSYKEAPEGRT